MKMLDLTQEASLGQHPKGALGHTPVEDPEVLFFLGTRK